MQSIDRRGFIAGLAVLPALRPEIAAAQAQAHGIVAESGKRGAWPLVVGLLATSTPDAHEFNIGLMRRRHGYPRMLRYMSSDRNKVDFASAVIDYAAASTDLKFTALVVDDADGKWRAMRRGREAAYASIYRQLLTAAGGNGMAIQRASTKDPRTSNLMQLAGFLCGCVYGDATGVPNALKRGLADRLHRQVDPARFSAKTVSI